MMTTRRASRFLVAIGVAALVVTTVGIAGGQATPARVAANSATFRDAVGENALAPDITTVAISNDAKGGLTFRVSIPSHPVLTEDLRIRISLDWDDNAATGLSVADRKGVDRFILVDRGLYGLGVAGLGSCRGTSCASVVDPALLKFSYRQGVATFSVETVRSEPALKRFRFHVDVWNGVHFDPVTRTWDLTNAKGDFAPTEKQFPSRDEYWVYDSRPLLVKSFSRTPATPHAGKPFALRLAATRTDSGALVRRGTVSCSMRIAGKPLSARSSGFVRSRATCAYSIPATAKGLRYRGTITIRVNGAKVARSLAGRVT